VPCFAVRGVREPRLAQLAEGRSRPVRHPGLRGAHHVPHHPLPVDNPTGQTLDAVRPTLDQIILERFNGVSVLGIHSIAVTLPIRLEDAGEPTMSA
jgi:hypothetical protein